MHFLYFCRIRQLNEFGILQRIMYPKKLNATYCRVPPGKERNFMLRQLTIEDCLGMLFILGAGKYFLVHIYNKNLNKTLID